MSQQQTPSGTTPSPEQLQQTFELSIWYTLALWPALHVAVQDNWGGPDSSDKRDWFAGAVADLLQPQASSTQASQASPSQSQAGQSKPDIDHDDLVVFLLQVMQDEFDCNVEDDSEEEVATNLLTVRRRVFEESDLSVLPELEGRWRNRGQIKTNIQIVENSQEVGDDEDWDDEDEDAAVDGDGDINMTAAESIVPDLVPVLKEREKAEPEVDEEGFTRVVRKGKR